MASMSVPSSLLDSSAARASSLLRTFFVVGAAGLVTACGGGGGGGGDGSSTPANPFPIAAPYSNLIMAGANVPVSLKAKLDGDSAKGNGTISFSTPVVSTFEGTPGFSTTMAINVSVIVDGDSYPVPTISSTTYYDSNYRELGGILADSTYSVVTVAHDLPAEARVGDSGPLYAYTAYSGPSKMSVLGSAASSYIIEKDTKDTVILRISMKYYTQTNALIETDDYRYRINAAGNIAFIGFSTLSSDGSEKLEFIAK